MNLKNIALKMRILIALFAGLSSHISFVNNYGNFLWHHDRYIIF